MVTQATEGMAETTADRRVDRFAGLLALVLGIAAILVFVAGLRYGPHLTEISLPDGLCGFAKGHFVYVGTREDGQCRFLAMTESHGWAGVETSPALVPADVRIAGCGCRTRHSFTAGGDRHLIGCQA